MFLDSGTNPSIQAGVAEWLSRWPRDPHRHKQGHAKDKPASGPLARRGSNPFPGANFSSFGLQGCSWRWKFELFFKVN
jgi:hypothetical protein